MDLQGYLRLVRRRWGLILGCAIAAVAVAAVATSQATPLYSSTAALFVSTSQRDSADAYQGSLFSQQRVASYANLTSRQELSRRVIERLGLDMEPSALAQKITAGPVPDTVILEVSVTDPDPLQAQRLTQAVSRELISFVSQLETPPGATAAPIKTTMIDPASLPEEPVSPQPVRNLGLAAILGLVLGLSAAALRELLDSSVASREEAAAITGAPVMAAIAFDPRAARKPLVTDLSTRAARLEAFRVLRTNMQFAGADIDGNVFVVTSSVPREGKTTTATNLAITLAQAGQEVLLLEADLRRPRLAADLDLDATVGLTTALGDQCPIEDVVQDGSVPHLSVISSGPVPPNPAELLQSSAMSDALEKLRKMYDVVIVDTPPLLPVTDASLLAAQSDGALIVVRHGKTTREQLRHATERLVAVEARAVGVVLNMVRRHRWSAASGDDRYGYGYGYVPPRGGRGTEASEAAAGSPEATTSYRESARPVSPGRKIWAAPARRTRPGS